MLDGEAYFSVKKDTASPFIVEASQLSVKVLGTRFNVKAYPNDEKITTTLTSGKVEVSVQSQPPHILNPMSSYIRQKIIRHPYINDRYQ